MDELQMATANRLLAVLADFKTLKGERVAAWDDVIIYASAGKAVLASGVQRGRFGTEPPQYLGSYEIICGPDYTDIRVDDFDLNWAFKVGEL